MKKEPNGAVIVNTARGLSNHLERHVYYARDVHLFFTTMRKPDRGCENYAYDPDEDRAGYPIEEKSASRTPRGVCISLLIRLGKTTRQFPLYASIRLTANYFRMRELPARSIL